MKVRLFFATDVHGSEVCWRKFINSAKHYEANVLILGGDMTGKAIVPVVENGPDRWQYHMQDLQHDLQGEDELAKAERLIRDHGYYPVRLSHDQVQELHGAAREARRRSSRRAAPHRRALGRLGRRAPRRQRHPVHRLSGQRRPARHRRDPRHFQGDRRGRGQRPRHARRLSARLQRLDQPHAVGHAARRGRARPQGAHRGDRQAGDRAARAPRARSPRAALRHPARRRPQDRLGHPHRPGAGHRARGLDARSARSSTRSSRCSRCTATSTRAARPYASAARSRSTRGAPTSKARCRAASSSSTARARSNATD